MSSTALKTRFVSSLTGLLHLGNVHAALFSALYAHHCCGGFVMRSEDTDQQRSRMNTVPPCKKISAAWLWSGKKVRVPRWTRSGACWAKDGYAAVSRRLRTCAKDYKHKS